MKGTFDPNKMYDVSEQEMRAMQERAKIRAAMKAEFQKKVSNPYRGVGGYIFDPAVQRFMSMRSTHWEQFKPTTKSFALFMAITVLPIALFAWKLEHDQRAKEAKFRRGEVSYKDRQWKFV